MFISLYFDRSDTDAEIELIKKLSKDAGAFDAVACTHWSDGGMKCLVFIILLCNCFLFFAISLFCASIFHKVTQNLLVDFKF